MSPDDTRHGTSAGYCAGCRGVCCRTAIADYNRHLRTRKYLARGPLRVDALGTKRRLQALMALGWTTLDIDAELGRERTYTAAILCGNDRVLLSTAHLVRDAYERMAMRLPEDQPGSRRQVISRTRNLARRKGWPPPLAWDDIDDPRERPMSTNSRRRSSADLLAEFAHLTAIGESAEQAAKALGVSLAAIEKATERERAA